MTTEIRPFGAACNLRCTYCYQDVERASTPKAAKYDLDRIKRQVEGQGGPFTMFGGEPLLMPIEDLADLFSWGYAAFGRSSIQTNGLLITREHIDLFRRFNVSVGISIDGPDELNDSRQTIRPGRTRNATRRIEETVRVLCSEGTPPSLIVTLHRRNAAREHLPRMNAWFTSLDKMGVRHVRLHILEVEHDAQRATHALTVEENIEAFLNFHVLEDHMDHLRFDVFEDLRTLLKGSDDGVACVWKACDPYTTRAVKGIEGNGQLSNCGRASKDGVNFRKADHQGFERYLGLYVTPQTKGGCAGCRFFFACKGQCPGSGINMDWRNRSEHCPVWMALFSRMESELIAANHEPLSLSPMRALVERQMLEHWRRQVNPRLTRLVELARAEAHSDVGTAVQPNATESQLKPLPARVLWVSDRAREVWQPRLDRVRKALSIINVLAVTQRLHDAFALWATDEVVANLQRAEVQAVGRQTLAYVDLQMPSAAELPPSGGDRFLLITAPEAAEKLKVAWFEEDGETLRHALGWPSCCSGKAAQLWRRHIFDLTWPTHRHAGSVPGDVATNVFWHPLGVRLLAHWPCAPTCAPSVARGRQLLAIGKSASLDQELAWIDEIFSWPVSWSARNGIVELKTPILKAVHQSDSASRRHRTIEANGSSFPSEGSFGRLFPFNQLFTFRATSEIQS